MQAKLSLMTTKPFDQFNKRLFQELLSAYGQVTPNLAVLGEERAIDVFFAPYPNIQPDPAELGVLAAMTQQEERRITMALSQVYLEWEKQTKHLGVEEGIQQGREQGFGEERRATIESLLRLRFGSGEDTEIDRDFQAIIPNLMSLPNAEYTRLLLQKSKEELIQYFRS
jgi:hypothetical protein